MVRLIVGKLGDSAEVPGDHPLHAFVLAVSNEFTRLKGQIGRDHSSQLVGKQTPFGQCHDSVPFQPGDLEKEKSTRPPPAQRKPAASQQQAPDGVGASAGLSFGVKHTKGKTEAAVTAMSTSKPITLTDRKVKVLDPATSLPKKDLERLRLAEHETIAADEMKKLWLFSGEERERVKDFFTTLRKPNWRLETVKKDGTEVWRLPGGRVHTIMGVGTVNAAPKTVLELFDKPEFIFTRLFPRIDKMFVKGVATVTTNKHITLCYAQFKLPNLVGPGSAPLVPARDFVWTQVVSRLSQGNLLVTAKSYEDPRFPEEPGLVRGKLLTSGYYGRVEKDDPGRTRVYYMAQADPMGILPKWLVNLCAGRQAANVERLAEVYKTGQLSLKK